MVSKGDIPVAKAADDLDYVSVSGNTGYVLTEDSTATDGVKWAAPGTYQPITLGYAQVTANQTGIQTQWTTLTGLSVDVTVPAGRRIRVTGYVYQFDRTAGTATYVALSVLEGGVELARKTEALPNTYSGATVNAVISPSAGAHTYYLGAYSDGTLQMDAGATTPAFILVEDVTGTSQAYQSASVPVGQLAYAPITVNQGSIAAITETTINGLTANIAVPAGRTLRITVEIEASSTVADAIAEVLLYEGSTRLQTDDIVLRVAGQPQKMFTTLVLSPSAGAHTYFVKIYFSAGTGTVNATAYVVGYLMVEDITPTPAPASGAPGSTLAYAEVVANQGTFTGLTDLTGLAVTITIPAGRRIRIKGKALASSSVDLDVVKFAIFEGGTQLQQSTITTHPATWSAGLETEVIITPSAGTHTYKLAMQRDSGTGNITMVAGAAWPAFILVEDITGAVWPTGSPVTAGMVASEQWIDFIPVIAQGATTNIAKTIGYSRYTKIGRTVTWEFTITITGTGTAAVGIHLTIPVPGLTVTNGMPVGSGFVYDASASLWYMGMPMIFTPEIYFLPLTNIGVGSQNLGIGASVGTATMGAALANGDVIAGSITYEAAS